MIARASAEAGSSANLTCPLTPPLALCDKAWFLKVFAHVGSSAANAFFGS